MGHRSNTNIPQIIANQFRALEEDEIQFLDSIRQRQEAEERQRKQEDGEELKQFKQYDSPFPHAHIVLCIL